MEAIGRKRWVIPEGFIPPQSMINANRALLSHEAACLLNTGDADAHVEITLFFTDREPVGPYKVTLGARRTLHLRFNELSNPEPVPPGEDTPACSTAISRLSSSTPASTAERRRLRC